MGSALMPGVNLFDPIGQNSFLFCGGPIGVDPICPQARHCGLGPRGSGLRSLSAAAAVLLLAWCAARRRAAPLRTAERVALAAMLLGAGLVLAPGLHANYLLPVVALLCVQVAARAASPGPLEDGAASGPGAPAAEVYYRLLLLRIDYVLLIIACP